MEEMFSYPRKIEISGSDSSKNILWREQRIHRVLGYAQALADINNSENFYLKIDGIHDHKGMLTVTWMAEPTKKEKEYLDKAWESIVADFESEQIEHIIT